MIGVNFIFALALVWLVFATVEDLKKREVSNWLNFSLIILVLGARFFYSLFYEADFNFFLTGLLGLGIFFILGNLLYHLKIFAGGDAKLMVALGAVIPFSWGVSLNLYLLLDYILLFFFFGALYGLFYTFFFAIRDFSKFKLEFFKKIKSKKKLLYPLIILGALLILIGTYYPILIAFGIYILIIPLLFIFTTSVEKVSLIREVSPSKLSEGDWLSQEIQFGKKKINVSWEGLTAQQIEIIKKHFKSVKIRYGIPFVPVFLISFLVFLGLYYFDLFSLFI